MTFENCVCFDVKNIPNSACAFIHKHHRNFNFHFVQDLARAHFSIETIALMYENLPFFKNTTRSQNVLQTRPKGNLGYFGTQSL
jgi:hypothetical protein